MTPPPAHPVSPGGPEPGRAEEAAPAQGRQHDLTKEVVLKDGTALWLRPIAPDDGVRLQEFHAALSERAVYLRFFSPHPELSPAEVERFTHVDNERRVALVATLEGSIIGVGRYDTLDSGTQAEVAFIVADAFQGRGIAKVLLRELAEIAREHGIDTFVADTLLSNQAMRRVFSRADYVVRSSIDGEIVHSEFAIA